MRIRVKLAAFISFSLIMGASSLLVNPFYITSNQHDIIAKSYTKTQTAFDSNTCTIESDNSTSSLNCANINPQTLGEKNFVDVDNSQASVMEKGGEQGPPGPQGEQGPPGPPGPGGIQDLVHVVWQDATPANWDILYRRNGADFDTATINLSNTPTNSFRPVTAVSGNNIHVIFEDESPGNLDIFYKRSTDGGASFENPINLSNDPENSFLPHIAVSGSNVYVVWFDDEAGGGEIFYTRSTNGGANFESAVNLSNNPGRSLAPAIATSENNVYVVWWDTSLGNEEIFYTRSTDGGANFESISNLSNDPGSSVAPSISASDNSVYLVWVGENPLGGSSIFFRSSSNSGINFGLSVIISGTAGDTRDPSITSAGENVHIVWEVNNIENSDIFYRRSINMGISFDSIINISNNIGLSSSPAISITGNNIYVVWQDTGMFDDSPDNHEIFYRKSINNGASFQDEFSNLSSNTGFSFSPSVASAAP